MYEDLKYLLEAVIQQNSSVLKLIDIDKLSDHIKYNKNNEAELKKARLVCKMLLLQDGDDFNSYIRNRLSSYLISYTYTKEVECNIKSLQIKEIPYLSVYTIDIMNLLAIYNDIIYIQDSYIKVLSTFGINLKNIMNNLKIESRSRQENKIIAPIINTRIPKLEGIKDIYEANNIGLSNIPIFIIDNPYESILV